MSDFSIQSQQAVRNLPLSIGLTETRALGVFFQSTISSATTTDVRFSSPKPLRTSQTSFYELSAWGRVRYLARLDRGKLAVLVAAVVVGVHLSAMAVAQLGPLLGNLLSISVRAQTAGPPPAWSSPDSFHWYIGGMLGVIVLFGIIGWLTAKTPKKADQGYELTKTVTGFAIGFLAGRTKVS